MKNKRLLISVSVVFFIFLLTACKLGKVDTTTQQNTTMFNDSLNQSFSQNSQPTEDYNSDGNNGSETTKEPTSMATDAQNELTEDVLNDDPSLWTKERIVEEYKNAAAKSDSGVTSNMKITLKDIRINNGEYDKAMSMVKPIIGKFIESNSTSNPGITGGYQSLVPQDLSSAKAYKEGSNTVIELVPVEQTSGPREDANSGSVGHVITAVGDIGVVVNGLSDMGLPLELSETDTKIYYTSPSVRVVVNENGEIISGTWSYTVEICMDNMKAFGQTVEKASITMDNTITV